MKILLQPVKEVLQQEVAESIHAKILQQPVKEALHDMKEIVRIIITEQLVQKQEHAQRRLRFQITAVLVATIRPETILLTHLAIRIRHTAVIAVVLLVPLLQVVTHQEVVEAVLTAVADIPAAVAEAVVPHPVVAVVEGKIN